jgi:hypothetical protein
MLKGTRTVQVTKIQPVSIHGQISRDVHFIDPDDALFPFSWSLFP